MAAPAPTTFAPTTTARPPLFRGYTLVALVAAWVGGIALRPAGPLVALTPLAWILLAVLCLAIWIVAGVIGRMLVATSPSWRVWRALLMLGMLGCCAALGAARAAGADTRYDASSVGLLANGRSVVLQ